MYLLTTKSFAHISGDGGEAEENLGPSWCSDEPEGRHQEGDGVLSWRRKWDGSAGRRHHPRRDTCSWLAKINCVYLLLFFSFANTLSRVSGFRYGSDIVPFSKVDQEQMKYKHDGKCFAVLGFTKRSLVRDFSRQWLFHHLTHWFNKPKVFEFSYFYF